MSKNKVYRTYLLTFIISLSGLMVLVAVVNIYFDPLMCFGSLRPANRIVPDIDARLQKTNHLLYGVESYDAVLLGSSRVEQFRQQDFAPMKTFNYAAPSFYPDEAAEYIDLFLRKNKRKTDTVFLGLDFYGSNARAHEHAKPPQHYSKTSQSPFYRGKTSLCRDTLKYSFRMTRKKKEQFRYDRKTLDKITQVLGTHESEELARKNLDIYESTFYGDYCYNEDYAAILRRLKARHPDLRFVVFTTPVSADLFALLVRSGRLPDYERWIKDIVDVFGSVYNFAVIDRLTTERRNFLDAHHLYPERTAPLARIISGKALQEDEGIGQLVTTRNLAFQIAAVREQARQLTQAKQP